MTADVVSPLLSDPQPEPVRQPWSPELAADVAAGYVETDVDAWYAEAMARKGGTP